MASPSGSTTEICTVSESPSATLAVAGAVTTGARSVLVTVMVVVSEPESALLAVKMTLYVPVWEKFGVQLKVPLVLLGPEVNVAPGGRPDATRERIGSLSGSATVIFTVSGWFSATVVVAGAVTTGARSVLVTVMAVVPEPESALLAVNVTL